MNLEDYKPKSKLVVKETKILQPRFSVIEAHNHLRGWFGEWDKRPVAELLDRLDEANVT